MAYERNGRWYTRLRLNGRLVRQVIKNCTNKKMAELYENSLKQKAFKGEYFGIQEVEKIRFKDFAKMYMESYAKTEKQKSWQTDHFNLETITPVFGEMFLSDIKPLDIINFKNQQITSGLAKRTVNCKLALLSVIFRKAIEWDKFAGPNPLQKVPRFKEDNARLRFYSQDELDKIYESAKGELLDLVKFAANTGMRLGEIMRLTWQDVDLNRNQILIRESKSGKSRHVPINANVKNLLLSMKKLPDSSQIFSCDHDIGFRNLLRRLEIEDASFHTLRHTFASNLAMRGVDLLTISKLLGHANTKMTERYAHLSFGFLGDAVERLVTVHKLSTNTNEHKKQKSQPQQLQKVA